jgi:2,4-dienoyl-CoA reductase-like NADH-dependent reductase (Old Yellow Enzyme family)
MTMYKLFSPFYIRSLVLHNQIVMPAMATNYATEEGFVTERQIAYYVERAIGDAFDPREIMDAVYEAENIAMRL